MPPPRWIGRSEPPHIGQAAPIKRLLVTAPGWVASADWQRIDGSWRCVRAGMPISWMVGMAPGEVHARLEREGLRWEWSK